MAEAELARFVDRYTVEFVRHYPHPIERVWRAVTEAGELAQWFIRPSVWDLKSGGAYRFEEGFKGVIEAVEPPRLIRFNFADPIEAGSYFQFELMPQGEGTRLRFLQHAEPGTARAWQVPHAWDTPWGGGNLGGWHSGLEELADLLDGVPCGSRRPGTAFGTQIVLTHTELPPEHLLSVATGWHIHLHDLPEAAIRPEPAPWSLERERERAQRELAEHVPRYRTHLPREAAKAPWTN